MYLLIEFVEYDDEIDYPMKDVSEAFHPQVVSASRLLRYPMYDWKNDVDIADDHSKTID